jgi:hypothetical protein
MLSCLEMAGSADELAVDWGDDGMKMTSSRINRVE